MSAMSGFLYGAHYLWPLKPVVNQSSVNVKAKLDVEADVHAEKLAGSAQSSVTVTAQIELYLAITREMCTDI